MHQQGNIIVNISFSHKVEVQKKQALVRSKLWNINRKNQNKIKKNKLGPCYVIDKADYQEQINKW